MKSFFQPLLAVFVLLLVGGCTASFLGGSNPQQQQQNMTQINYAAADMLIQQSKSLVTAETPVQIGVLSDMDRPAEPTALGRVVTGQIGARFVQLGYNVSPGEGGSSMDSGMSGGAYSAGGMGGSVVSGPVSITGQYALAKKTILINLRLTEMQSGRVLAAYDYSLPLNGDTRELSKTAADKNSLFGF